jgi:hypothetical protein
MRVRNSVDFGARGVCDGRASDRGDDDRDDQGRRDSEAEPAIDSLRQRSNKKITVFFFFFKLGAQL